MQQLAVKKNLVTQMGNQGHAFEGAYLVKEWYQAGLIGEVREVVAWTDRPKGGWGFNGNVKTEYPKARWEEYRAPGAQRVPKTIPRPHGIHRDWVESIKNGKKACSDFAYSGPLTEAILLGTLAIRTGKTVKWNAEKMQIDNNPEAAKLINVEARQGWRTKDLV